MADLTFLNQLLTNNTFGLTEIEETLNEVKSNSFNYLYKLQLDLANTFRFNFHMSDLKMMQKINNTTLHYPRKYVLFVDKNFISSEKRSLYMHSDFYDKELSIFDTAKNSDLFDYTYMVFVDGKFMDTINILCKEDTTYIIFDINDGINTTGIPYDYYTSLLEKNADITILFVPNCTYGVYNTNRNVLEYYENNLSLSKFDIAGNLDTENKYLTFINSNDYFFASVITDTSNSADMLRFYNNNSSQDYSDKYLHLNIFGMKNLLDQVDIPANSSQYFQIERQDMPVTSEKMLIFKNINNEWFYCHDMSVKIYYPNIYEVIGNDNKEQLRIYILYADPSPAQTELKYKDELELYRTFSDNLLQYYKNNTIPDIIKNYKPIDYIYDIADYQNSQYNGDDLKYKIKSLKDWVKRDNEILRKYLDKQVVEIPDSGYFLDCSKVNLPAKFRVNNYAETSDDNDKVVFSEGRYVFIFRNEYESNFYRLRFFIDGYIYIPDQKFRDDIYEYYYIPASLVKTDSIIEIERYNDFVFGQDITFADTEDVKTISITNSNSIYANDIFLVKADDKTFLSPSDFKVTITKDDGTELIVDNTSFKQLSTVFKISLLNSNFNNVSLLFYIKKISYYNTFTVNNINDTASILVFDTETKNDPRHFRVFRNGRLLPISVYNIDFSDKLTDKLTVGINMIKNIGDTYVVDCTPYKYKQVYYSPTISKIGYVDLKNYVDKPFDLKWYDIYLNGIKLTKRNIDIISPTKIFIKNVSTTKNLYILEKNRDTEIINILDNVTSFNDILWDSIPEFQAFLKNRPEIPDEIEDVITQTIDDMSADLMSFYSTVISSINFINPDILQLSTSDITEYPSIFLSGDTVFLNPDNGFESTNYMEINPDKTH